MNRKAASAAWRRAKSLLRQHGLLAGFEVVLLGLSLWALSLGFPHSPDFLGSVVAFETTAVALTVPLFLNVAFKVLDTYGSRAVRGLLFKDVLLTRLIVFTLLNSLAAIAAHGVFAAAPEWVVAWRLPAVFAFGNCFAVALMLLHYLKHLRERVVTEPDWILDHMESEAMAALRGEL